MERIYSSSSHDDSWDDNSSLLDGSKDLSDSFYSVRTSSSYTQLRYADSPPESRPVTPETLTKSEAIEVVTQVIENTRQNIQQQAFSGGQDVGDVVSRIKLTADLTRQRLGVLPEEIVDILKQDVAGLALAHNHIQYMPLRLGECSALTFLNLRGNDFKEFPRPVLALPLLQVLDLTKNKLSRIPEEVGSLRALKVFSLRDNNLEALPLSLGSLEALRVLKVAGNPLNEALSRIVVENETTPSPLSSQVVDNERDASITIRIKQYLKRKAVTPDYGESSESPVETPRPLKRNPSLRFPVVVPILSGSESAPDNKSPGLFKPAIPVRSHYRGISGTSITSLNGGTRRPGVSPLVIGSERSRSNSESVLQASQNLRNKRMGMLQKKTPELSTLDETRAHRNSFHYRGASQPSALRERQIHGLRTTSSHGSPLRTTMSENDERQGFYVRRLSSLPERKNDSQVHTSAVEGAKGILYALHTISPYMATLLAVVRDGSTKRSSLERVYYNAETHLQRLDRELSAYEGLDDKDDASKQSLIGNIEHACRTCIISYKQVITLLLHSAPQLVSKSDSRYIRTLLILMYGSNAETINASSGLRQVEPHAPLSPIQQQYSHSRQQSSTVVQGPVSKFSAAARTPTKDGYGIVRRLRSDTLTSQKSYGMKSSSNPYAAVPIHSSGLSRSNSRSNISPVAGTPRSIDSFARTRLPVGHDDERSGTVAPGTGSEEDIIFEKTFNSFVAASNTGARDLPFVRSHFQRALESVRNRQSDKSVIDFCSHIVSRTQVCMDTCDMLRNRLSTTQLKDLEIRTSTNWWTYCIRYMESLVRLFEEVQRAKQKLPFDPEVVRILRAVRTSLSTAITNLRTSPWAYVLLPSPPGSVPGQSANRSANRSANHSANHSKTHSTTHSQWSSTGSINGHQNGKPNGLTVGYTYGRARGDSEASLSPYVPTTPLSAALGPAAQATIPSTPISNFDRSFQGDVFQRAEYLQNALSHRR